MKTHIIIHGHFYQPPRENPWTGEIPIQPSAAPYSNWNERIFSECYQANSASRYLNGLGRVVSINNNYENMSFNFGPTLINWIKYHHPETYQRIIDADAESAKRHNGHGNAIAQVYNHIILPLADEKDKRTQVEWGIADFESHFHRKPEGMWLAETAIDYKTIDVLIEYGIKFVILSPWQCQSVYDTTTKKWKAIQNPQEVTGKPYILQGTKGGELAAFFYDHILAQGVSFEHFLRDADKFYAILKEKAATCEGNLLHCATDGEVYGHHEPYGDMCFSALTEKIEKDENLLFDNYGSYLAEFPPTQIAKISLGEKNLGSSWSCSHGVSRWYKDCGCNTGNQEGWNQKWRKPLRDSFDALNIKLRELFNSKMQQYSNADPEEIWNHFVHVLTGEIKRPEYAKQYGVSDENRTAFFQLLESRKFSMYMYTSCGWFFSELSGIEPVQNICYALRALELIDDHDNGTIRNTFLTNLSKAKSNIPEKGTGKEIALAAEKEYKVTKFQSIAQVIAEVLATAPIIPNTPRFLQRQNSAKLPLDKFVGQYYYQYIEYESPKNNKQGTIYFKNWQLQKNYQIEFDFKPNKGGEPYYLFNYKGKQSKLPVSQAKIPLSLRHQFILHLLSNWGDDDESFIEYALFLHNLQGSGEEMDAVTLGFFLDLINLRIGKMLNDRIEGKAVTAQYLENLRNLTLSIFFNDKHHLRSTLFPYFSDFVYDEVKKITIGEKIIEHAHNALELLNLIYTIHLNCDLTIAQGIIYDMYQDFKAKQLKFQISDNEEEVILKLIHYLNIETEEN